MILEHGLSPLSAKWDNSTNSWDIGQKKTYRWLTPKNEPASDWFTDIRDALDWIIDYETNKV